MTRRYRQHQRAQAADGTRERIVAATFALHMEKGVAATSMTEIAARAGVGVGTVYHHFPTYDDAVSACGAHVAATRPPPSATAFAAGRDLPDRIRLLTRATFDHYASLPGLERVRADRERVAVLQPFFAAEERHRLELTRAALAPAVADDALVRAFAALLDLGVYSALRRMGLSAGMAAATIADFILARLAASQPQPRRRHSSPRSQGG